MFAEDGEALVRAAQKGHLNVVKELLNYREVFADVKESEALVRAAENGHLEVCKHLVHGTRPGWNRSLQKMDNLPIANPAKGDAQNGEALARAAQNGHIQVCELLLSAGYHQDDSNPRNFEILKTAAEKGDDRLCLVLLNFGGHLFKREDVVALAEGKSPQVSKILLGWARPSNSLDEMPDLVKCAIFEKHFESNLSKLSDLNKIKAFCVLTEVNKSFRKLLEDDDWAMRHPVFATDE